MGRHVNDNIELDGATKSTLSLSLSLLSKLFVTPCVIVCDVPRKSGHLSATLSRHVGFSFVSPTGFASLRYVIAGRTEPVGDHQRSDLCGTLRFSLPSGLTASRFQSGGKGQAGRKRALFFAFETVKRQRKCDSTDDVICRLFSVALSSLSFLLIVKDSCLPTGGFSARSI